MDATSAAERRFALRIARRIPIVVSGRQGDGSAWSEPTETTDISSIGVQFEIDERAEPGDRLRLRAPRADGGMTEVTATVVRTAPAAFGRRRVGAEIAQPVEGWIRLFVSWVADGEGHAPAGKKLTPATPYTV